MAKKEKPRPELRIDLNLVDLRCPYCGRYFYFRFSLGDQDCPGCGSRIKLTDVAKVIRAEADYYLGE